jgi:hypothetical protein
MSMTTNDLADVFSRAYQDTGTIADALEIALSVWDRRTRSPVKRRLTREDFIDIRTRRREGESTASIAERYGLSLPYVRHLCAGVGLAKLARTRGQYLLDVTAETLGIPVPKIVDADPRRRDAPKKVRWVAAAVMRRSGMTLPQIGRSLNCTPPTYALRRVEKDPEALAMVVRVEERLAALGAEAA